MKEEKEKEEKEKIEFSKKSKKSEEVSKTISQTFRAKTVILEVIDLFFGLLMSSLITLPLVSIAHFIRTFEWIFLYDILTYLIYLGLITLLISVLYLIFVPLRTAMEEQIKYEKDYFYKKITSIIFAWLILQIFIDPIGALATYIGSGFQIISYDLGTLVDNIIASIILLAILLIYYQFLSRKITEKIAEVKL